MTFNCDQFISVCRFSPSNSLESKSIYFHAANKGESSPDEDNDELKIALIHTFPSPSARNAASVFTHCILFLSIERDKSAARIFASPKWTADDKRAAS